MQRKSFTSMGNTIKGELEKNAKTVFIAQGPADVITFKTLKKELKLMQGDDETTEPMVVHAEKEIEKILSCNYMDSQLNDMTKCAKNKISPARYVKSMKVTHQREGCLLTIATALEKLEGSCVQDVILSWVFLMKISKKLKEQSTS